MSINSYQVIVVFGLAVTYIDEHKLISGIAAFGLVVGYIDEHKLISGNCCIWFGSRVY